ncbi:MAG: hypothetical protein H7306_06960 [Bacteriovorax sp.]|nr:hypothetical protein [Rhizobacter sp.]
MLGLLVLDASCFAAPAASFGVCEMLDASSTEEGSADINIGAVDDLLIQAVQKPTDAQWADAKLVVVGQPARGMLSANAGMAVSDRPSAGWQKFVGKDDFLHDSGVVRLQVGGRQLPVNVDVAVAEGHTPDLLSKACPRLHWRVSGAVSDKRLPNIANLDLALPLIDLKTLQNLQPGGRGLPTSTAQPRALHQPIVSIARRAT